MVIHGKKNAIGETELAPKLKRYAGHKRPGSDDDSRIIEETGQYIRDFDRIV
jgi:hypothetical protein